MSLGMLLALIAIVLTVASAATGRVPLWTAVFVLCLIQLLAVYPR